MQAVIYCRVSTVEQTENLSLTTQEEAARDYCARHGWPVAKVFVERGESAKTTQRPQLQALLRYCRTHRAQVHHLVVYSLSRLARDKSDHFAIRAFAQKLGITLRSVTEAIDETSTGKLMEGILAAFAQFDNDVRSERTVAGMKAAVQRGMWVFPPPAGYRRHDDKIEPDPALAPVIREAFELMAAGNRPQLEVMQRLLPRGLKSRHGQPLSLSAFNALLRNPFYAGWLRVRPWGVEVKGSHEPIVEQSLYDRVQAVLAGRCPARAFYRKDNPDFPLRRFVRCGACDRALTGAWAKGRSARYAYYWCPEPTCRSVKVRQEALEQDFARYLASFQPRPELARLFHQVVLEVWNRRQGKVEEFRTAAERNLKKIELRRQRLLDAYIQEASIDRETYLEQLDKINQDKSLAQADRDAAKAGGLDVEGLLRFADYLSAHAGRLWREVPAAKKRDLQAAFFPAGVSYAEGTFRTAVTGLFFSSLQPTERARIGMVAHTGFEPVLPP